MRLTLLALLVSFLAFCAQGHIIDGDGNCVADCHDGAASKLTGTNHAVVNLTAQEDYSCGVVNTTYTNSDRVVLCLFFDQSDPPVKVVFSPRVDAFEAL